MKQLLWGQALGSVLCNAPLNGGLAWLLFPPVASLPLWARGNCVAGDTIGTSFFLPLITCLILTAVTRRMVRKGGVAALTRAQLPAAIRFWPRSSFARGALVGLICALTVALATLVLLGVAGFQSMTRVQVTVYKAIYTSLLGLVVTPLFGWRALAD